MKRMILVGAAMCAVATMLAPGAGASGAQKTSGAFAPVPGHGDFGVSGHAEMIRTAGDVTTIRVQVAGLQPGATYGSHVHNAPCSTGGGGHYMHDPAGPPTPPNELWPSTDASGPGLTANAEGMATGTDRARWTARPEAQSVVIHQTGNPAVRIACADLA